MRGHRYESLAGADAGHAFEGYILHEILAWRAYRTPGFEVRYRRNKNKLEVDFVLGRGQVAIEAKVSTNIDADDVKGLRGLQRHMLPSV